MSISSRGISMVEIFLGRRDKLSIAEGRQVRRVMLPKVSDSIFAIPIEAWMIMPEPSQGIGNGNRSAAIQETSVSINH